MNSKSHLEGILMQLVKAEKSHTSSDASRKYYVDLHKNRFADVVRLCQFYVPNPYARALDVGRSELTVHLRTFYPNITTLGLDLHADDGGHREASSMEAVPHIAFDLLNSDRVDIWPKCGSFDLIVFSEVLEHLSVAPEFVLAFLSSLLADTGILICTTPNATEAVKRLRLAYGQNPFERLRLYSANPGHVREYTRKELCDIAYSVGLHCIRQLYFDWPQSLGSSRIKAACMKLIRAYPPFRGSSVAIFRRAIL